MRLRALLLIVLLLLVPAASASAQTNTRTATRTRTATLTRVPTRTRTPIRSRTATRTRTPTRTRTATRTRTVTRTRTRTRTPLLPTMTQTLPPSATPVDTATYTAVPATATNTAVPPTSTSTPTFTGTRTSTPSRTRTRTATRTNTVPTRTPTSTPIGGVTGPVIGGCPILPANNIWNRRIDDLPRDETSTTTYVAEIGRDLPLHPDFGSGEWDGGPIGIPYIVVPANEPMIPTSFVWYDDESDPGPYPAPLDAPIEGGPASDGDRHVLVVQQGTCMLYELYAVTPMQNFWEAGCGATYDLSSNALRPDGWTSADAAGLPILPGLVRFDEVASGAIRHALRFTVPRTRRAYVWPARHYASSSTLASRPPMGLRFRLRADFDTTGFSAANRVIIQALKEYGMIIADNGSSWYLSGAPDERWDNDDLHELQENIFGRDFEVVDVSGLMVDPDSGESR